MNLHNPAGKEIALPVMRWLRPILEVPFGAVAIDSVTVRDRMIWVGFDEPGIHAPGPGLSPPN